MSFEEIKAAALALPEGEQDLLIDALHSRRFDQAPLSPAQAADLSKREAELAAHPEDAADGEVVMDRLFATYAPTAARAQQAASR